MIDQKDIILELLIKEKNIIKIRNIFNDFSITEKVAMMEEIMNDSITNAIILFRLLDNETSTEIFSYLDEDQKQKIIINLTKKEILEIINELYTDEVADLIEELPENISSLVLENVNKTTRIKIDEILKYEENQIGSIMSVDIILLSDTDTNFKALEKIRKQRDKAELTQIFFVANKNRELLGYVSFEDIVFSSPQKKVLSEIKKTKPLMASQDREEASVIFASEDLSVLPVINENNKILGMLTSDDVIDVLTVEATEDIYKGAGIISDEDELNIPYIKRSIISIVKSRIFWLMILMISATFSQAIIEEFTNIAESQFQKVSSYSSAILVALIPVISGVAGNSGSQSSSTITRAIALGEAKEKTYSKLIFKESVVGFTIGLLLMLANFIRAIIYYSITGDLIENHKFILLLSAASSVALFIAVWLSKVAGASIPLLAFKFKKDPAVLSSPILTTSVDALSTLIFFGIAILFLQFII